MGCKFCDIFEIACILSSLHIYQRVALNATTLTLNCIYLSITILDILYKRGVGLWKNGINTDLKKLEGARRNKSPRELLIKL